MSLYNTVQILHACTEIVFSGNFNRNVTVNKQGNTLFQTEYLSRRKIANHLNLMTDKLAFPVLKHCVK